VPIHGETTLRVQGVPSHRGCPSVRRISDMHRAVIIRRGRVMMV